MPIDLFIKNVPDEVAERLRRRAAANRRSLQRELMAILETAAGFGVPARAAERSGDALTIEELAELSQKWFPRGTESSVAYLRQSRESC
jgi:plasmid stability protein